MLDFEIDVRVEGNLCTLPSTSYPIIDSIWHGSCPTNALWKMVEQAHIKNAFYEYHNLANMAILLGSLIVKL